MKPPPPLQRQSSAGSATPLKHDVRIARFADATTHAQVADDWRDAAELLLSQVPCVFHRNLEISGAYAWMYLDQPTLFKWCGMASFASYHARQLLLPFRLKTNAAGELVPPAVPLHEQHPARRWVGVALRDIEIIRQVNNAIFRDILWAHIAYRGTAEGLARLRTLLVTDRDRAMLRGFELIERGRQKMASRPDLAKRLIWAGNLRLLWHEQSLIVQPRFDRLSCRFAQFMSLGSSLSFEPDNMRQRVSYSASFYLRMLLCHPDILLRTQSLPRITNLEHRWAWASTRVVENFRRLEGAGSGRLVQERLMRILSAAE